MKFIIDIFVAIFAILLIIVVMLQNSNGNYLSNEKNLEQKVRGVELFMQRATAVLAIIFVALVITSVLVHTSFR